ncbi:hypothetical protein [uncultured Albimonas sp.]|uniref:hypothetical protein n=1 Tax=uncultured Albimonas sp. TaxID=1331701 RepID=UPI0030ED0826
MAPPPDTAHEPHRPLEEFFGIDPRPTISSVLSGLGELVGASLRRALDPRSTRLIVARGPIQEVRGVWYILEEDLAMEVLSNVHGRYSVRGYAERADRSLGRFYLGCDRGAEYDAVGPTANALVGALQWDHGFDLALAAARRALAGHAGPARPDPEQVSHAVLTAACREWYGLPDTGDRVIEGEPWSGPPFPRLLDTGPPQCPNDFVLLSAHIFFEDPLFPITMGGRAAGARLRLALQRHVRGYRLGEMDLPGTIACELGRRIEDDEALASTLIGHVMGMVPTTKENFRQIIAAWRDDRSDFGEEAALAAAMRARIAAGDSEAAAARKTLVPAMTAAMLDDPTPVEIWRTVCVDHDLAGKRLEEGDVVVVAIERITQQAITPADGSTPDFESLDVRPVFGGDREPRDGRPGQEHACPGREVAMGLMAGMAWAVLETLDAA